MFWVCAGNGVDNTGMLLLLLSNVYAEARAESFHTAGPASRVWVHKKLREMTDGTSNPS